MEETFVIIAAQVDGMRFSEVSSVVQKVYCMSKRAWTAKRVSQKRGRICLAGAMMWRMGGPIEMASAQSASKVAFCSQTRGQSVERRVGRSFATRNCMTSGHLTVVQTADMPMQMFIMICWENW